MSPKVSRQSSKKSSNSRVGASDSKDDTVARSLNERSGKNSDTASKTQNEKANNSGVPKSSREARNTGSIDKRVALAAALPSESAAENTRSVTRRSQGKPIAENAGSSLTSHFSKEDTPISIASTDNNDRLTGESVLTGVADVDQAYDSDDVLSVLTVDDESPDDDVQDSHGSIAVMSNKAADGGASSPTGLLTPEDNPESSTDESLPPPEKVFKRVDKRKANAIASSGTDKMKPAALLSVAGQKRRAFVHRREDTKLTALTSDTTATIASAKKGVKKPRLDDGGSIRTTDTNRLAGAAGRRSSGKSTKNKPQYTSTKSKAKKQSDLEDLSDHLIEWSSSDDGVKAKSDTAAVAGLPCVDMGYPPCCLNSFSSVLAEAAQQGEQVSSQSSLPLFNILLGLAKSTEQTSNFLSAFNFIKAGIVLNPARASTDEVGLNRESRVVSAGTGSSSFAPHGYSGIGNNKHAIKKIGVWLLAEEFDRALAFLGKVYGIQEFYAHYFNDVLYFQTQREGAGNASKKSQANASFSASPKKPTGLFGSRTTPRASRQTSGVSFPPFVKFSDNVPIYDITKRLFDFSEDSFASLSSLPLYQMGLRDLPAFSMITVGYTVNAYPYTQNDPPPGSLSLSLNVQFILFHGVLSNERSINSPELGLPNDDPVDQEE